MTKVRDEKGSGGVTSSNPSSSSQPMQNTIRNDATGVAILLSNHDAFGFSERACYHFELMETLTQTPTERESNHSTLSHTPSSFQSHPDATQTHDPSSKVNTTDMTTSAMDDLILPKNHNITSSFPPPKITSCGVVSLLECVTPDSMKIIKKRKRFTKRIQEFNKTAVQTKHRFLQDGKDYCHQPPRLPCTLSFNTRVMFAYELTRIVLCIDASPTLTSTFGNLGNTICDGAIMPMDRIHDMVTKYFVGLIQPMDGGFIMKQNESLSSLETQKWIPELAVTVIACFPAAMCTKENQMIDVLVSDYRVKDEESANNIAEKISDWVSVKIESEIASRVGKVGGRLDCSASSLRHMIDACDVALAHLPSEGRPCIVIATDCRAVQCDGILELVKNRCLKDTPINVLDLSNGFSHRTGNANVDRKSSKPVRSLIDDPDGPSSFSLIMPDDSEALYNACKCTHGYFLDANRLSEAVVTKAGNVLGQSTFHNDVYFSAKKRTLRPNALQWHTVFSLSPCCPLLHGLWGRMPAPVYMQKRRQLVRKQMMTSRTKIKDYHLSSLRVKGLLIMRIMDGFRPKRYGTNSQDDDKVSIQFALNLELGTVIHYELLFVSSLDHNAMVGSAHIKISVSGEPSFIQNIKDEFEHVSSLSEKRVKNGNLKEKACAKIAGFILFIVNEDFQESSICSLDWDKKLTRTSAFIVSLSRLDAYQLYRHFRLESFEVVGVIDLSEDKQSQCIALQNQIIDAVAEWSTITLSSGRVFLKQLPTITLGGDLTNYCLIEVKLSILSNIYIIDVHFFEQIDVNLRMLISKEIKDKIQSKNSAFLIAVRPLNDRVLNSLPYDPLVSLSVTQQTSCVFRERDEWDLRREPDLFSLIAKRRCHFDKFIPLYLDDEHTILVKFITNANNDPTLIQYNLTMMNDRERASILMELDPGTFIFSLLPQLDRKYESFFSSYSSQVKERDEKCARVLQSRRNLLNIIESKADSIESTYVSDLDRLLLYASKIVQELRFFHPTFKEANSALEKLTVDFISSNILPAKVCSIEIGHEQVIYNMPPGKWFLVKYDSDTLSILHFPTVEVEAVDFRSENQYRELSLFTVAFSALYYYNIELEERFKEVSDSNFTTSFLQGIETAHKYHYTYAMYLALRNLPEGSDMSVTSNDFDAAVSCCIEESIIDNLQIKNRFDENNSSKLVALLQHDFTPIPGASPYMYFDGNESRVIADYSQNNEYSISVASSGVDEASAGYVSDSGGDEFSDDVEESGINVLFYNSLLNNRAPVIIFFTVNDTPMSLAEIETVIEPFTLNVFMIIFDVGASDSELQLAVASMLKYQLRSYIAEQTLEELLQVAKNSGLKGAIPQRVQRYLSESNNIAAIEVPIQFYIPQTQSIVDASTSTGFENVFFMCYNLLSHRLLNSEELNLMKTKQGELFCLDMESHGWCVISIQVGGPVNVRVFHQEGMKVAEKISLQAMAIVQRACYEVNQFLLLDDMQRTRNANDLLIAEDGIFSSEFSDSSLLGMPASIYSPGYFRCSIVHEVLFPLNKHCSPKKALALIKDTIFHAFAVLNRLDIFVYKDEDNNVFYMKLSLHKEENESYIKLNVHGIEKPGVSITKQLDHIIQKKLLTMAVESISLSLAKSNRFKLSSDDINFITTFQSTWRQLDEGGDTRTAKEIDEHFFAVPSFVFDPIMMLLYFRQNISGSSFFNIWHQDKKNENVPDKGSSLPNSEVLGRRYVFDRRDFSLYYNATRFQLDPQYQAVSTLTKKGEDYSRKASTGIALVEFRLIDRSKPINESEIHEIYVKSSSSMKFSVPTNMDDLKMIRLLPSEVNLRGDQINDAFCVGVKIHNTTLDVEAIYDWIELTLNQAVVSWCVERHLESTRLGLSFFTAGDEANAKLSNIDHVSPGLASLGCILLKNKELPHPGVKGLDFNFVINGPDLAGMTAKCLEQAILPILFDQRKITMRDVRDLSNIRITNNDVQSVHLKDGERVQVIDYLSGCNIWDRELDSLQYVSVYGLNAETEFAARHFHDDGIATGMMASPTSLLFKTILVNDYLSISNSLSNSLRDILTNDPYILLRRVAFLVSVRRDGFSVLFYNWNPQSVEMVRSKLNDIFNEYELQRKPKFESVQFKSLFKYKRNVQDIQSSKGPMNTKQSRIQSARRIISSGTIPSVPVSVIREENTKKSERGTKSILMPTIVGKSIQGSAQQALLASRARARVTPKLSSKKSNKDAPSNPKAVVKARDGHAQDTEESIFFPPNLRKEFLALQMFIVARSLQHQVCWAMFQQLYSSWIVQLEGKELPFRSIETIVGHSISIGEKIFPISQLATSNPVPFFLYFLKSSFPNFCESTVMTISKNFVWNSKHVTGDISRPIIFAMKKIWDKKGRSMYLMHEISFVKIRRVGQIIKLGSCRSWILMGSSDRSFLGNIINNVGAFNNVNHRRFDGGKIRKDALRIQRYGMNCSKILQPSLLSFMFSINILRRAAMGHLDQDYPVSPPALLREIMSIFPFSIQTNSIVGCWYRLISRIVPCSLDGTDFKSVQELLSYTRSQHDIYGIVDCTILELCLSGHVDCEIKDTNYFICAKPDSPDVFEIYALCCTRGDTLERFVFEEGNPYARTLSTQILNLAEREAKRVFTQVCRDKVRERLWVKYSTPSSNIDLVELNRLRKFSAAKPLKALDPRLYDILTNEFRDLGLSMSDLISCIKRDSNVLHQFQVMDPVQLTVLHVICMEKESMFVYIGLDTENNLRSFDFVTNKGARADPDELLKRLQGVVENLTQSILEWIWQQC